jgi:G3E family GTPase
VIETTGLADPVPILAGFATDPALRWHYRLGNLITVVDAVNGLANLDRFAEARRQAVVADRLVVSKADLADQAPLLARLNALNPDASVHQSDQPDIAGLLRDDVHEPATRAAAAERWPYQSHAGHEHHGPDAFTLTAETPLDWAAFGTWLSLMLHAHGASLLRLKGLLHVAGVERPVVVQGVQHLVHPPVHLEAWPDGRPRTRLVLIGTGLDRPAIERSFRAFCGLPCN